MLQSLSELFQDRQAVDLDETDVRHFVERYLRGRLGVTALFCDRAEGGEVVVRALTPMMRQEIYLLTYDLGLALQQEARFTVSKLVVTQL